MPKAVYIADPVVADAYHIAPGEWASIDDPAEAAWLVAHKHAATLDFPHGLPAAGFVHPQAPLPFVPWGGSTPPPGEDRPSTITVTVTNPKPGEFDVTFGGQPDASDATGHFVVLDDTGATLADVTYPQPADTTRGESAGLLHAALLPVTTLSLVKAGTVETIKGVTPDIVVASVLGALTVATPPAVARRGGFLRRRAP